MVVSLPRYSSVSVALLLSSVGLLLAYLFALSRRPDIPDFLTVQNRQSNGATYPVGAESSASEYGFPRWYGKSPSPYDATWSDRDGAAELPKDVLLIIDLPHDSPNVPHALGIERALRSLPKTSVRITSSFSASSDGAVGLVQNLRNVECGQWTWRIGESGSAVEGCEGSTWISEILPSGKPLQSVKKAHDPRANIELVSRPQGLFEKQSSHGALQEQFGAEWELGLMSHVMPFADPTTYYPTTRKTIRSITYFPSPFTKQERIPHLPFGGGWRSYKASASRPSISGERDPLAQDSKYRAYWLKQEQHKADVMRSSGICIFENWAEGQLTQEMAQAMMSGCVIATVSLQIHREILDPWALILPKPQDDSGELPVKALAAVLAQTTDADLKLKALRACLVARQMMSPVSRIKEVANIVELWQEGGRGYNLPHAFSWNCNSEPRPPWC